MFNKIRALILAVVLGVAVATPQAQAVFTWNQALSSDCTALTTATSCGGIPCNKQIQCWDTTKKIMYTCDPASGNTCTTSTDWRAGGGGWLDDGTNLVPLNTVRNVGIGTTVAGDRLALFGGNFATNSNLIKGTAANGIRMDADGNNASDVTISPTAAISAAGGFVYTGTNPALNVARSLDKSSPTTGDAWYNTTNNYWAFYDGALNRKFATSLYYYNSLPSPTASSNKLLFKVKSNARIESIDCIVDPGGAATAVINIQICNANGSSCANVDTTSITCSGSNSADDGSLSAPTASNNSWINLNVVSVTGSPSLLTITIKYAQTS